MIKNIIRFLKIFTNFSFNATGMKNELNTKFQKAENYNECNITIANSGLTYNDVKSIALDIYNSNFPKLAIIAKEIAQERIDNYIEKLIPMIDSTNLNKFVDVGLQYDFSSILKTVAIRGNIYINDLLTNVFLNKLNSNSDYDSIALSSVIDKISKISIEELNILGLYALTKNIQINEISEHVLSQLIRIDKTRCHEYCSNLASNGLVHWTGGFAKYPNLIEDNGIMSNYIKQINEILKENVFVNFEILNYGKIISEKYLEILDNKK